MDAVVALLRSVNVGGRGRLPMADLRAALDEDGLGPARTYLQSGNVVLAVPRADPDDVADRVARVVERRFGVDTAVLVRTPEDLDAVDAANPFLAEESDGARLHVVFLRDVPDPQMVATLDHDRSPGDRFSVLGREVYCHYPNGSGRSKLTLDWFERQLGTVATARNWNTVSRLRELVRAAG